jgi:hypothetical protein
MGDFYVKDVNGNLVPAKFGGRTRTRTLDPLIKSKLAPHPIRLPVSRNTESVNASPLVS